MERVYPQVRQPENLQWQVALVLSRHRRQVGAGLYILFAVDGEVYNFNGYKCIVIGGAYSVDKHYRLAHGLNWWPDEQPDDEIKATVEQRLAALGYKIDIVLSHTCPRKYEPTEVFLSGIDQSAVDKSTEDWLDGIENRLDYMKWYCGHYRTRKQINKMQFMYEDFDALPINST